MRLMMMAAGGVLVLAGLAACQPQETPQSSRALFGEYCAACHGGTGSGDGALARGMGLAVPDITWLSAANGGVFPMLEVMAKIDGYTSGERGGEMMPEFGTLLEGERVMFDAGDGIASPTPLRLVQLAEHVQSLQQE